MKRKRRHKRKAITALKPVSRQEAMIAAYDRACQRGDFGRANAIGIAFRIGLGRK